jgi:hypothetical protein
MGSGSVNSSTSTSSSSSSSSSSSGVAGANTNANATSAAAAKGKPGAAAGVAATAAALSTVPGAPVSAPAALLSLLPDYIREEVDESVQLRDGRRRQELDHIMWQRVAAGEVTVDAANDCATSVIGVKVGRRGSDMKDNYKLTARELATSTKSLMYYFHGLMKESKQMINMWLPSWAKLGTDTELAITHLGTNHNETTMLALFHLFKSSLDQVFAYSILQGPLYMPREGAQHTWVVEDRKILSQLQQHYSNRPATASTSTSSSSSSAAATAAASAAVVSGVASGTLSGVSGTASSNNVTTATGTGSANNNSSNTSNSNTDSTSWKMACEVDAMITPGFFCVTFTQPSQPLFADRFKPSFPIFPEPEFDNESIACQVSADDSLMEMYFILSQFNPRPAAADDVSSSSSSSSSSSASSGLADANKSKSNVGAGAGAKPAVASAASGKVDAKNSTSASAVNKGNDDKLTGGCKFDIGSLMCKKQKILQLSAEIGHLRYQLQQPSCIPGDPVLDEAFAKHMQTLGLVLNEFKAQLPVSNSDVPTPPTQLAVTANLANQPLLAPKLLADFGLRCKLDVVQLVERLLDGSAEGGVIASNPALCAWLRDVVLHKPKTDYVYVGVNKDDDGLKEIAA